MDVCHLNGYNFRTVKRESDYFGSIFRSVRNNKCSNFQSSPNSKNQFTRLVMQGMNYFRNYLYYILRTYPDRFVHIWKWMWKRFHILNAPHMGDVQRSHKNYISIEITTDDVSCDSYRPITAILSDWPLVKYFQQIIAIRHLKFTATQWHNMFEFHWHLHFYSCFSQFFF